MIFRSFLFASMLFAVGAFAPAAHAARCGSASHYGHGDGFNGLMAADGSRFNAYGLTTASPSLPFGTMVQVVNQDNGKSVVVKTTDRGPFVGGRILDLSYEAFRRIASPSQGVARICYSQV